jgi:hypothetical protein
MWYQATLGDDCSLIPQFFMNSFTSQDLISWNPALKNDCSGIIPGKSRRLMARPRQIKAIP